MDQRYARFEGTFVYSVDTSEEVYRDEAKRAAIIEFVQVHGIDPDRFIVGNPIRIRRHDDGKLWVHTWQAVAVGPNGEFPLCKTCPFCVEQEPVVVPLAAGVPEFADGPYGRV